MTIDSVPELARRVRHLETLVKRGKPADGSDNASLLKRISALESSVARIGKAAPTKPQVYTPKPAATVPKPANNSLAIKVSDHGALTGLEDNDHPQYLLTTGKAADSDKLDGIDSTGFATAGHDHNAAYLGINAKAADSDKLDGIDSTGFVNTSGAQTVVGIKTFSSIPVLPASNPTDANHAVRKGYADATYLGIPAFSSHSATITASSGTFTTVSAVCRVTTLGKLRIFTGYIYITDKGTATGTLRVSIPTGSAKSLNGGYWAGTGNTLTPDKACIVNLNPSNSYVEIVAYDGTTVIVTGKGIQFSIMYELA